ncbi:LapA family protein [methane-oxidizing endosymbiont of Gigantopelta aegis]|uniref:LapA family protein n=1 Tax=methane-oxidizing endosymbiont of Gigantopelta aegis TaxID=2794938 RepID=UPI0018DB6BD2|nr:LapA family protein [methane-oxidizing endosymbiont of Gigantopelta aegis]
MKLLATLVFISIFFVALVFSVLNFQSVEINLYFFKISLPLTVALTVELFGGIIIGYLVAMVNIMKLKAQYSQLSRQLAKEKHAE